MILRKLTTVALAWPLVRHLFHFVRKYVAGQKCGSCPPFLLQTLNIKPRHTLLEPELYSWQQAISPAIKSLPHSGHAVEPMGTMQNQQIIVVVLGSKGDCRCHKAEHVHGMCWCDTHSWLQYDGGISGSCCYGSCWCFRSNVQYSAWIWFRMETHCTSHWMTWIETSKESKSSAVMW